MTVNVATPGSRPLVGGKRGWPAQVAVYLFVIVPFLALIAAVPLAWGWGLSWVDIALAVCWYTVTCLGVTVGFHRHFTHGSFKATRPLRIALAIAGSMAVQGPIRHWVEDHRRHHALSDVEGDPHSPSLFGASPWALVRGFWHAHLGGSSTGACPTRSASRPTWSPTGTWPGCTGRSGYGCS